jgi:hypothetical protein
MQTACPVKEGRDQKNRDKHLPFFTGINVIHDPVNGDRAKQADEGIKNNIGIIITKTENIKDRKYFDKRIALEIIPIRIFSSEKFEYPIGIWITKKVDHVLRRILKQ